MGRRKTMATINSITIIENFTQDNELDIRKVHYLDPDNNQDDCNYLRGEFTTQFDGSFRLYRDFDQVDGVYTVVYLKPVIYRDVWDKWIVNQMALYNNENRQA